MSTLCDDLCHINHTMSAQKGKDKKKAKYDSLQELKKNKKELEFEQKLYKEKEEMLEKEKQLKINRLAQEVCVLSLAQARPASAEHNWVSPHRVPRGLAGTQGWGELSPSSHSKPKSEIISPVHVMWDWLLAQVHVWGWDYLV